MILTEKETTAIKDLQTQEQACIDKYNRYSKEAHDEVLKDLFSKLADTSGFFGTGACRKGSFLRLQ